MGHILGYHVLPSQSFTRVRHFSWSPAKVWTWYISCFVLLQSSVCCYQCFMCFGTWPYHLFPMVSWYGDHQRFKMWILASILLNFFSPLWKLQWMISCAPFPHILAQTIFMVSWWSLLIFLNWSISSFFAFSHVICYSWLCSLCFLLIDVMKASLPCPLLAIFRFEHISDPRSKMYNVGRIISVMSHVLCFQCQLVHYFFWVAAPGLLLLLDYRYMLCSQYVGDDTLKSYCPSVHLLHCFGIDNVSEMDLFVDDWFVVSPIHVFKLMTGLLFPPFALSSWWLVLN
jgi:hypothetical protein